jgi:hypothetical protein
VHFVGMRVRVIPDLPRLSFRPSEPGFARRGRAGIQRLDRLAHHAGRGLLELRTESLLARCENSPF